MRTEPLYETILSVGFWLCLFAAGVWFSYHVLTLPQERVCEMRMNYKNDSFGQVELVNCVPPQKKKGIDD